MVIKTPGNKKKKYTIRLSAQEVCFATHLRYCLWMFSVAVSISPRSPVFEALLCGNDRSIFWKEAFTAAIWLHGAKVILWETLELEQLTSGRGHGMLFLAWPSHWIMNYNQQCIRMHAGLLFTVITGRALYRGVISYKVGRQAPLCSFCPLWGDFTLMKSALDLHI